MRYLVCLGFALLAFSASVRAEIVLSQPLIYIDGRASSVSGGVGFVTHDRITLDQSYEVNRISWVGAFIDLAPGGANPVDPLATSWTFEVAQDGGGSPGAVTDSAVVAAAGVTALYLADASLAGYPVRVYEFSVTLADPLLMLGGSPLWLAIIANTPAVDPRFAWFSGSGGDGVSQQQQLGGSVVGQYTDRALTLEGRALPEPTGLAWAALAIALALYKRRSAQSRPSRG